MKGDKEIWEIISDKPKGHSQLSHIYQGKLLVKEKKIYTEELREQKWNKWFYIKEMKA